VPDQPGPRPELAVALIGGTEAAPMDQIRPDFFAGPYIGCRADVREEGDWLSAARIVAADDRRNRS
jgi:hypothetical protein